MTNRITFKSLESLLLHLFDFHSFLFFGMLFIPLSRFKFPKRFALLILFIAIKTFCSWWIFKNLYNGIFHVLIKRRQLNCCADSWENYFGSVGRQNNNPKFQVGTSENKIIDHRVKKDLCYFVNISYMWNRPRLCTASFNNVKCISFCFLCILLWSKRKISY